MVAEYDSDRARAGWDNRSGLGVWRYSGLLPIRSAAARITLGEGSTALLPLDGHHGTGRVWIKNESSNPTWSYKDRLATVGVSAAAEAGAQVVIASSSGNHGAAVAAYASAAGLRSVVLTAPETSTATRAFLRMLGAEVFTAMLRDRMRLIADAVDQLDWYPLSAYTPDAFGNPYAIEGYKTIAFEIVEQLGRVPRVVLTPTSIGEGLSGMWAGFRQLTDLGITTTCPRMVAVEPAAGAPLARAIELNAADVPTVDPYPTVATSIAAATASDRALVALRESGGRAVRVSDADILAAQRRLGRRGLFAEPAAAAAYAAMGEIGDDLEPCVGDRGDVVIVLTSGGLRTVDVLIDKLAPVRRLASGPGGLHALAEAVAERRPP